MNRNFVIIGSVIVLLILAAGSFFFLNRPGSTPAVSSPTPQPSTSPSVVMEKTSLKSFMGMSGDQKCEFSDPETNNSGAVYLSSGKFRGDFSSNINGKLTPSHMINDGKDVYIWMDDQQTGFKTTLEAIEQVSGTTGVNQTVDINKQVDYKCESWTADPLKFVVPVEIKFQDMGKMMQDAAKMMPSTSPKTSALPSSNAAACATCDNLEGQARTQCRTALKCN